jgi:hypothetical protein
MLRTSLGPIFEGKTDLFWIGRAEKRFTNWFDLSRIRERNRPAGGKIRFPRPALTGVPVRAPRINSKHLMLKELP